MAQCDSGHEDEAGLVRRCGLRIAHKDQCTDGRIKWEYMQLTGAQFAKIQEQISSMEIAPGLGKMPARESLDYPKLKPEHTTRLDQLANACKAVDREIRKLQEQLKQEGIKFPDSLPILLDQQRDIFDCIFVILSHPHLMKDANH